MKIVLLFVVMFVVQGCVSDPELKQDSVQTNYWWKPLP